MTSSLYMPADRYLAALKRIRALIEAGSDLEAIDDDTPGDKSTECTWGLCSREREAWPEAEDHLWPYQFTASGRVSPKYLRGECVCPMMRRTDGDRVDGMTGCFYACRIFKASKKNPAPTREEALRLYDEAIAAAERRTL